MAASSAEGARVAHEIRGRVRFDLPRSYLEPRRRAGIAAAMDRERDVIRHRFNPAGHGLIVEHAPGIDVTTIQRLVDEAKPADVLDRGRPGHPERHVRSLAALGVGAAMAVTGMPLAVPVISLGSTPIFGRAMRAMRRGKVGVDALDATAMTVTMASGQLLTAAVIAGLVEGGELLRDLTARRSRRELAALMSHQGAKCWKITDGHRVAVDVGSIRAGDRVFVANGDRIPVDARVLGGRAVVDERVLTGESVPVTRSQGDVVFAMTVVHDGELRIEATGTAAESRAGRIMAFLERVPIGETRMADHARRIADRFVLPVLGAAAVVYALTGNATRSASILIFDLATGIRVAAPTTMLASLVAAAREGILIKGAAAMEKLAGVDAIIFDKTGTLTAGTPVVTEITTFNGLAENDVLGVAAGADKGMNHPLAAALVAEAERRRVPVPRRTRTKYHIGLGVDAVLEGGDRYLVGSRMFLELRGVPIPRAVDGDGLSKVFVATPNEVLGAVGFSDDPRPEAAAIVRALRERGITEVVLLSGDTDDSTRRVADALGVREWRARMSPEQKADYVRALKKRGRRVAVVGDGVNDSVAFALADLSIAMGGGADMARANSDVVLLDDRLELIPRAIDLSRESLALMNQNIAVIAAPNAAGLGAAVTAGINPAVAAFLSNGSTVVAAANGLRPLLRKPQRPSSAA